MISAALTDWRWCNGLVDELPARYERSIISRYTTKYKKDSVAANVWLRVVMGKIKRVKMPLIAISSDDSAASWAAEYYRLRYTTARNSFTIIDELFARYMHLKAYAEKAGFVAPGSDRKQLTADQLSQCVAQLDNEKWWQRQAKRTAAMAREYMALALGLVGKGGQNYISAEAMAEWKKQQQNAAEFLEVNYIACEMDTDSGQDWEFLQLAEASKAGTADPRIRRLEMMTRIRGMKEAAEAAGQVAVFITWTAPGVYHVNSQRRWNGADPRDTQRYLTGQWAKCRAELNAEKITVSGLRVVEPHNDETPHWHLLLFVAPGQKAALLNIMRRYALQHLTDEKGAQQHRFTVEEIDPAKGCAVAYIAKYISKSINAEHVKDEADTDQGEETGDTIGEAAEKCRAWASRWRIRQFQFIGSPPVTIWRELRRIREGLDSEPAALSRIDLIHHAADRGNFAAFIKLMGGKRSEYPVNTIKRVQETSSGTIREKIAGIITAAGAYTITRKNWFSVGSIAGSLSRFCSWQGASRAAWTRVNNCKLDPEAVNEKLAAATQGRPAIVGYLDALGRWIVEKVTDYFNKDYEYEYA